jgi:hypothetical protein
VKNGRGCEGWRDAKDGGELKDGSGCEGREVCENWERM